MIIKYNISFEEIEEFLQGNLGGGDFTATRIIDEVNPDVDNWVDVAYKGVVITWFHSGAYSSIDDPIVERLTFSYDDLLEESPAIDTSVFTGDDLSFGQNVVSRVMKPYLRNPPPSFRGLRVNIPVIDVDV